MNTREQLKREFDAEEGSFLLIVRSERRWDWTAFHTLTGAMYDVAEAVKAGSSIETWIAHGFWFCDTWIRDWTSHANFPRPDAKRYDEAIQLIHDLAYFLFCGQSPYENDTLRQLAKG